MRPGPRLVVMVALAFISGAQCSTNNNKNNNQQQRESHNLIYNNIVRGKLLSKRDESAKQYDTSQHASASFTTSSFLSNINPWLSACDLANPKATPDLQVSIISFPLVTDVTASNFQLQSIRLHRLIVQISMIIATINPLCTHINFPSTF